jgi:signal transduction histidine kinase
MDMHAGPAQILIVDDHLELAENIVEILAEALGQERLHCELTRDREGAMAAAERTAFELALVDLHLPDGNGLELMADLKARLPFVQVVLITGDATIENAIRALQEGAFGYVLKPFQAQQLMESVTNAIERSRLLREREALRVQLEESERRNREVLDRAPALILALDEAGRIAVWNRQLEEVTGFTRQEMFGKTGDVVIDNERVVRLQLKGGGHRSVAWKTAVVPQAGGRAPLRYAVGADVTEEREMQLRAMRAERLAAVGTLAAGLAHEVRNPLNSATLQLQVLERKLAKGKLDEASVQTTVVVVKSELERLDALVSDFLAFAKPKPITPTPSDLNELIRRVVQLVNVEAASKRVELKLSLDDGLGLMPLDPQSIRQVLLNLIRNAIEALSDGGAVTICTRPAPNSASVQLQVIDDGPGFPEDSPVFDAFYTTKDSGTGLGLAIVYRVVSEHGGNVSVHCAEGETCFSIELPYPASTGKSVADDAQNLHASTKATQI